MSLYYDLVVKGFSSAHQPLRCSDSVGRWCTPPNPAMEPGSRWMLLRTISFAARKETRRQQAAVNKIRLLQRRRSRRRCDALSMISETGESTVTDVGDVASLEAVEALQPAQISPYPRARSPTRLIVAFSGATTSMLIISTTVALLLGSMALYLVPIADILMRSCEMPGPVPSKEWAMIQFLRLTPPPAAPSPPPTTWTSFVQLLAANYCWCWW